MILVYWKIPFAVSQLSDCVCCDIIPAMADDKGSSESPATTLCKSCGMCCSGHLFLWARLHSAELDHSEALGLTVIRNDPRQRGFHLPCPLWHGQCTIYTSPDCPRVCHSYKCKLLKELDNEDVTLDNALPVIQQAKQMIKEIEPLLPAAHQGSFRQRFVAHLEYLEKSTKKGSADLSFQQKAKELLNFYENRFGVNDLIDKPEESEAEE